MSSYGGYDTPDPSQTFEHVAASSATENSVTTGAPTRKRKRGEFDTDPDVGTSLQAEELRKLKARAPAQDNMHDPAFIRQQTGAMINAIKDFTDDDGNTIYEPFTSLPDREDFPDYYTIVKKPVCLDLVEERLENDEYTSLQSARDDLNQIFNNAKHYNQNGTSIYEAAQKLQKTLKVHWKSLNQDLQPEAYPDVNSPAPIASAPDSSQQQQTAHKQPHGPSAPPAKRGRPSNAMLEEAARADPLKTWMLATLKKLINHEDEEGRKRSEFFMILPSRDFFPEYYQIIEYPIAFSQLQSKVKKGNYTGGKYENFINDVSRVFNNAKRYNNENSLVYQDALALERLFKDLQKTSPVSRAQPQPQPKVKLRLGGANRQSSEPSPAAWPAATGPEKITLRFGGGAATSTSVPSTAIASSTSSKLQSPVLPTSKTDAPSTPAVDIHAPRKSPVKLHAQISLPPKSNSSSLQASDLIAKYLSAPAQKAPMPTPVDNAPMPPPIANRIPKTLTCISSDNKPHLPVFHIRPYYDGWDFRTPIFLNSFTSQHTIALPANTFAFDLVASTSVSPLPSTLEPSFDGDSPQPPSLYTIFPGEDDPCVRPPEPFLDEPPIKATRSGRPAKGRQSNGTTSSTKPSQMSFSLRSRPGGSSIKEDVVDPDADGPFALARFACRLGKQELTTFELSATSRNKSGGEDQQNYRLFVTRSGCR